MPLNSNQNQLLQSAAQGVKTAWNEQWTMLDEDDKSLAAEYLMTSAVARNLSALAPGRVRIERLIGRAFRNVIARQFCTTPVDASYSQGRIDVVVNEDNSGFKPLCLIELKREFNRSAIESDASRIAYLIECTNAKLPDIFGFCLFPVIISPDAVQGLDYQIPLNAEIAKIDALKQCLEAKRRNLSIFIERFAMNSITRPSVVKEVYDDETEEDVWDSNGFRMEPFAIVIQKMPVSVATREGR